MLFKMMCFKVFSKFLIGLNGFQNDVFQSVFKIPIGLNGFQNDVFQSVFKMVSMVFKMMCFKSVFKMV